ncbi:MAG: hypothetical protein U0M06_09850, partial [Clostridia bacterium]|nr:hypothetical protein [Clostridia bacterium]
ATAMRNFFADKNPEFANYIKEAQADFKESRGYSRDATKKDMEAKDVRILNNIRPKLRAEYKPSAEEMKIMETATSLPRETFLTAGNLADLSETNPEIYKAYTAFIRTATRSKALETDEPYYYGDSTRDNGNGIIVSDSFIEAVNRENGMRFSSWSDWRIQHLLDWITAVIDNSVRGAAMHGYTKYGDEVRVLGKTGMMFNLSGVAGTQTGLNEDGSLSFSDTESVDINEAIELREEFPETAGLQCIGVSKEHIIALLRSDIIDYVIPYHTSGLNATLRRMGNIYGWDDFTLTQHADEDKSIKKADAVDPDHWHQEPVFSEFFVGYDTKLDGVEAMRKSAENYKRMCKERGLIPKFLEFSNEPNYWKLLIDRKMVNQKTNTLIKQRSVTPDFDFDVIKGIVKKYVDNYDSGLEQRAFNHIVENWDSIPARIRDLKKQGGTKAKTTKKAMDKLANETVAALPKGAKASDRATEKSTYADSAYIDAENSDTAQTDNAASTFVTHMRNIVENTGGWDVHDVFDYVGMNPDLNFIDRILAKDKAVKKDLESFLEGIDDTQMLHGFSWFMGEAYKRKAMRYGSTGRLSSPYQGAVRTFRNAVDKRINEIMTLKNNGTNLGVKNGEVSLDEIKDIFDRLNSNADIGALAERVFATARKLGVNIRFANQTFSKKAGGGDAFGDMIELKTSYFNDTAYTDQRKAQTILHELIHTCTVYVMNANGEFAGDIHYGSDKTLNYERISNAATRLNRIYLEIKNDPNFKGQYGIKNAKEMVAELANPDFVELLKKKTLWQQVLDWICELFGFRTGTSAYDNAMACLDYILDNPEVSEYKDHALRARRAAHSRYGGAFGSTVLEDGQRRYSDRPSQKASYAPTFYSHMGKVIDDVKLEKMGTSSILNHLKNRGVKDEEIKWSGIETFLEGKKSVTKAELQEFVAGSQLQIEEEMAVDERNADIELVPSEGGNKLLLYIDGQLEDTFTRNKYGQLESQDIGDIFFDEQDLLDQVKRDYAQNVANTNWSQYKLDGGSNYREIVFKMPNSSYSNRAMRGHWGQEAEGVLAHARIQDFEVDGKRMLFIEEIQSDWHNEGDTAKAT